MSVSSVDGEVSGGDTDCDTSHGRPSICFVPMTPTMSDPKTPTGQPGEWTPVQGFLYSSVCMPNSNQSTSNDNTTMKHKEGMQLAGHLSRSGSTPYHMVLIPTQSTEGMIAQYNQPPTPQDTTTPSISISVANDTQPSVIPAVIHHEVEVHEDTDTDKVTEPVTE